MQDTKETQAKNDEYGSWFDENCELDETKKVAVKVLVTISGMSEKLVREGMERKGYKYKKDLCGLGKNEFGKHYKGGYEGIKLKDDVEQYES